MTPDKYEDNGLGDDFGEDIEVEHDEGLDGQPDFTRTVAMTGLPELPSGDARAHYLMVAHGPHKGSRVEITDRPVIIGRREECALQLNDPKLSGLHCSVVQVMGQVLLSDLDSTNGTFFQGERITEDVILPLDGTFQVGDQTLCLLLQSRTDVQSSEEIARDLGKAILYVEALLPEPLASPSLTATWKFVPSAQLGGDAFGYHWIDPTHFAIYLIDVCGHGAGAAMHSVSAINVLRQQSLPDTDFCAPDQVLNALNTGFDMERHGGMYFTIWYGVYDTESRRLTFGSAGHPPAFLLSESGEALQPLRTRGLPLGTFETAEYSADAVEVAAGSRLYVYSDGVFEIEDRDGKNWQLADLESVIRRPLDPGQVEPERIYEVVQEASCKELMDDFSLVVLRFS